MTDAGPSRRAAGPVDDRLRVFAMLWAAAAIFHIGSMEIYVRSATGLLVLLAGAATLATPRALPLLAVSQLIDVGTWMPIASDHWIYVGFINLAILLVYARRESELLFPRIASIVRTATILLYVFVVLQKLNANFTTAATSSATNLYRLHAEAWPFLPTGPFFDTAAIGLTLGVEAAIPVLLCIPRTRAVGVALGSLFHFVLAYNPVRFHDFSSLVFACYFMFVADSATDLLRRLYARLRPYRTPLLIAGIGAAAAAAALVPYGDGGRSYLERLYLRETDLVFTLAGLPLLAVFLAAVPRYVPASSGPPWPWEAALVAALMTAMGLAPYVGLNTRNCFEMYADLRTAGDHSNHLFMPNLRLWPYQDEIVEIVASSDPAIARYVGTSKLFVLFELRRLAGKAPDASITYRLRGETFVTPRIADDPQLQPPHFLAAKVLRFDRVPRRHAQRLLQRSGSTASP